LLNGTSAQNRMQQKNKLALPRVQNVTKRNFCSTLLEDHTMLDNINL